MTETKYARVAEVAERFDVTTETVREWVKAGHLKAVRVGKTIRIPRTEIYRLESDVA